MQKVKAWTQEREWSGWVEIWKYGNNGRATRATRATRVWGRDLGFGVVGIHVDRCANICGAGDDTFWGKKVDF